MAGRSCLGGSGRIPVPTRTEIHPSRKGNCSRRGLQKLPIKESTICEHHQTQSKRQLRVLSVPVSSFPLHVPPVPTGQLWGRRRERHRSLPCHPPPPTTAFLPGGEEGHFLFQTKTMFSVYSHCKAVYDLKGNRKVHKLAKFLFRVEGNRFH